MSIVPSIPQKRRAARKPVYREHQLQGYVMDLLRFNGVPGLIYFHPANEGKRKGRTGNFLKRMGMLPGVADIVIVLPGGICKFLELKTPTGRSSMAQIAFATACAANGAGYWLANTPEEAAACLQAWGALKTERRAA